MLIARPRGNRRYVPRSERSKPESEQAFFLLSDLTEKQRVELQDEAAVHDDGGVRLRMGRVRYLTLRAGLRGWGGLFYPAAREGEAPEPIPFEKDEDGRVSDECLALLPEEIKVELAEEIRGRSEVTEDERGKSEPSPGA